MPKEIYIGDGPGIGPEPLPRPGTREANRYLNMRPIRRDVLKALITEVKAGTAAERQGSAEGKDPEEAAELIRSAARLRPLVKALALEQGKEFTPEEEDALGFSTLPKKTQADSTEPKTIVEVQ